MAKRVTNLPPADYKTFAELADYAKRRAKISANRRAPQDFEYWFHTAEWAQRCAMLQDDPAVEFDRYATCMTEANWTITMRADFHAKAIHCRRILTNRGEKPPLLSLDWLREAAKRL